MSNTPRRAASVALASITALLLLAMAPSVRAGQAQHSSRHHAVVQILRDPNGNALRFGPRNAFAMSENWSGYILPKFETKQKYLSASGTWTVPSVTFEDAPSGFDMELSATWVGIGGYCKNTRCRAVDHRLIQLGTEQDAFSDNTTSYYAWYEMLPAFETPIPSTMLAIHPGDTITASLTCAGKCKGKASWTLTINDVTTRQNFSTTVRYRASKLSAEWIEEAPSFGVIQPLADFNTVALTQSVANGAGADLSLGDSLALVNPSYGPTSNISRLNSTLDGFSACWGANRLLTSCSPPL